MCVRVEILSGLALVDGERLCWPSGLAWELTDTRKDLPVRPRSPSALEALQPQSGAPFAPHQDRSTQTHKSAPFTVR
jgi:hypothetical protein